MIKIGINGFGRIGKNLWHLLLNDPFLHVTAINHPMINNELFIYMANNDTLLPNNEVKMEETENGVIVNDQLITLSGMTKPEDIEWNDVDVVVDCSGKFKTINQLQGHLKNNVKLVVLSAPSNDNIYTIINGVNDANNDKIISCGSCTTNCLAPILKVMDEHFGIEFCNFLTVHAMTASQTVSDRKNIKDFRLGRNASQNIIPTTTGASGLVRTLFPHLNGKVFGSSCRVPVENGSYLEINFRVNHTVSKDDVLNALKSNSVIQISNNKNVSSDIKKTDKICCIDEDLIVVYDERNLKIGAWYNNEAGYVNQIIEVIRKIFN